MYELKRNKSEFSLIISLLGAEKGDSLKLPAVGDFTCEVDSEDEVLVSFLSVLVDGAGVLVGDALLVRSVSRGNGSHVENRERHEDLSGFLVIESLFGPLGALKEESMNVDTLDFMSLGSVKVKVLGSGLVDHVVE